MGQWSGPVEHFLQFQIHFTLLFPFFTSFHKTTIMIAMSSCAVIQFIIAFLKALFHNI